MSTQKYRHPSDRTVGENSRTPTRAVHPGAPELPVRPGRENKTPAPVNAPTTTADQARSTSWGRSGGGNGDNPGKNGFAGPSSLNPGERAGPATVNAGASTDAVLDGLVRGGVRGLDQQDNWQTRSLDDAHDNPKGKVPVHPNMTGAASGAKIPAKLGDTSSDHAERIAQRMKPGT